MDDKIIQSRWTNKTKTEQCYQNIDLEYTSVVNSITERYAVMDVKGSAAKLSTMLAVPGSLVLDVDDSDGDLARSLSLFSDADEPEFDMPGR